MLRCGMAVSKSFGLRHRQTQGGLFCSLFAFSCPLSAASSLFRLPSELLLLLCHCVIVFSSSQYLSIPSISSNHSSFLSSLPFSRPPPLQPSGTAQQHKSSFQSRTRKFNRFIFHLLPIVFRISRPRDWTMADGFWLFEGLEDEPYGLLPLVNLSGKVYLFVKTDPRRNHYLKLHHNV